jgi:hypothetical protein
MGVACGTYGEEVSCIGCFGGKTVIKIPLGRPRSRWKNIIKMAFQEIG